MMPPMTLYNMSWILFSCLMLLSQVQGQGSKEDLQSPRISCPKGSQAYASHCYALFRTEKSWFDADRACQKRPSGHLVSVLSEAEGAFVSSLVKSMVNNYEYVWMGLHDSTMGQETDEGGWQWSNDDVLNYFNWDKDPCSASQHGYCGTLTRNSGFRKWTNYNCDLKLPYVCKFKN
uniref:Regenerating islet-derived protein 3-gamma-like n=1 Tax=Jaculus jaculus TaxID=51337 RepID=A0A8C5LM85_JACJA|nr:regenerating islet-derived protein 3-gamma-like [Jaculus jaculus]